MFFDNVPVLHAATITLFVVAAVNVLASIATLALMRYMYVMKVLRINLFLKIVIAMTACQGIYDCTFFANYDCQQSQCSLYYYPLFGVTGIAACSWSMLIITCVIQMILSNSKLSKTATYSYFTLVLLASFVVGGLMYKYVRVGDIGGTIFVYNIGRITVIVLMCVQLSLLVFLVCKRNSSVSRTTDPLYILTKRLIWYPIIQIISRVGGSTYDLVYNEAMSNYPNGAPLIQSVLLFAFVIFTPSAGLGAFVVFLYIQGGAKLCMKRMCMWWKDHGEIPAHLLKIGEPARSSMNVPRPSDTDNTSSPPALPELPNDRASSIIHEDHENEDDAIEAKRLALLDEDELALEYVNGILDKKSFFGRDSAL